MIIEIIGSVSAETKGLPMGSFTEAVVGATRCNNFNGTTCK
jgi:hypothetical protein